jgi:hypothetical protein
MDYISELGEHNNISHSYSTEEVKSIEEDMKNWIIQQKLQIIENSSMLEVRMETVIGLSYAKDKEGIPFEHMAIQVGNDFYYHLVFDFDEEHNEPVGVRFQRDLIENIRRNVGQSVIGKTKYKSDDIMKIGKYLITIFGEYYKIFWNCQHFAKILANVLTEGTYDSSFFVTTDKFIAGFLFRIPFTGSLTAISVLKPSKKKAKKMLDKVSENYREILKFELNQEVKKSGNKLSKSWIIT